MRLEPLLTRSPVTGAVRPVTEGLLREVYLAPRAADFALAAELRGRAAPWSASLDAAPEATTAAVERALHTVMRATGTLDPAGLRPEDLPESRARNHLAALRDLWRDLGTLPPPLDAWAHVLGCAGDRALEPLPIVRPVECTHTDPAERALAAHLAAHHGTTEGAPAPARAEGALGALQDGFGQTGKQLVLDTTLRFFGLRDPLQEMAFAAALAQRMLDEGTCADAAEIGVLVPDDPAYAGLAEAFAQLGLPVSGAPGDPERDAAGEVLGLLLETMKGTAPATALASLYSHEAMPWPRQTGWQMAREVADNGYARSARDLDGPARALLNAMRPAGTPEQVIARLLAANEALPALDLAPCIGALRPHLNGALDWSLLQRLARPLPAATTDAVRSVEGVTLLAETDLPWRPVRQLIVLGMTGRAWPRLPGSDPFFTEGEIAMMRATIGLGLPDRRARLNRGLDLFRRQLAAATEGATLLAPARDLCGDRQSPSVALSLISHALGADDPAELLQDVGGMTPERLPVQAAPVPQRPHGGLPQVPASGQLTLGSDLLRAGDRTSSERSPQSPSRLESLIVSPLAWLLGELDARERIWGPEALDVRVLGSIIHGVLEELFPKEVPVPDDAALRDDLPAAFATALHKTARWLEGPDWKVERASLLREAETTVLAWARFLRGAGAEILHNEVALAGDHGGILIRGIADCLLRLPDGRVLIVDHKRSSSGGRRDRMRMGWDLQVALYSAMLVRPSETTPLTEMAAAGARPLTAYHTTRDSMVLTDPGGRGIPGVVPAPGAISDKAMARLAEAIAEVGAGTIQLNREDDHERFRKERAITPFALEDSPLVSAFLMPAEEAAE